ncbi:LuxR C-terminal-related transcriptional regulator [Devosia sp.]|uniref:LuxR C-terminal-related transcriptional regulator n=1 Tax=Devosia sp. TaxID=1871048 RepID=UPI001B1ACD4C|nr:LuxR C-terminal-related transcriptional regulator [Devosia sp.]MBO9589510.1 PAS domain-containing protein [Devosia sp.]
MQRVPDWTEPQRLFRALMENSRLLGWICEADGYCIYLSSAWQEFTGSENGLGIGWLNAIHPADRVPTYRAFTDANFSQTEYKVDYRLERPDGSYSMAMAHGSPHFAADGQYIGMFGITTTVHQYAAQADFVATVLPPEHKRILSDREREVLQLVAQGYTDGTAATRLGIAESTVSGHMKHAALKLGALSRSHAVFQAVRLNELDLTVSSHP